MEYADREKHTQTKNELKSKLADYKMDFIKVREIIEAL